MGERIEVNRDLPPARLAVRILNEMQGHALETLPEECCGLLVGDSPGRFLELHRCRNDMTRLHRQDPAQYPRDGRQAFHMSEIDYARIQRHADACGRVVSGVYHSHVQAPAYFSALDQQFVQEPLFPFPEADHFVLSVVDGKVWEVAMFHWVSARNCFEGRTVVPEAP